MGCVNAAPAKIEAYKSTLNVQFNQSVFSDNFTVNVIERSFHDLVKDVFCISFIPYCSPVLCLSDDAFPVIIDELFSEENEPVNFDIPIVCASQYGNGRIVCFGSTDFFISKYLKNENTEELISNSVKWIFPRNSDAHKIVKNNENDDEQVASSAPHRKTALLLGFQNKTTTDSLHTILRKWKINPAVRCDDVEIISDFDVIFLSFAYVTKDPNFDNKLQEFVSNGGGLFVIYEEEANFELNSCLCEMGVCFPMSNFIVGRQSNRLHVSHSFQEVNQTSFKFVKDSYIKLLKSRMDIDMTELDTTISVLHLYTSSIDQIKHQEDIKELYQETMAFLEETGYLTDDGLIAPKSIHILAIVQLTALMIKDPLILPNGCPTIEKFPGIPGKNEKTGIFTRKFKINEGQNGWISTGMWLLPSQKAHIKVSDILPTMKIQIGCHILELTAREGPYQRWPLIVNDVHFMKYDCDLDVVSPFGGFVYIVLEEESEQNVEIEVTFENFMEYPRALFNDKNVWEKTKERDIPWGEIESDHIIFTVPKSFMVKIEDYDKFFDIFRTATELIADYFCVEVLSPVRFVYDCQVLPGSLYPKNYNPVFMHINSLNDLLKFSEPSTFLFQVFTKIGMSLIFPDHLDHLTKKILSIIASLYAFTKIWPDKDPLLYTNNDSPLTKSLWEIHQQVGEQLIPHTIDQLRDILPDEPGSPDDAWIAFVMLLSKNGGKNFTSILQKVRPIPLNATLSVQQLPAFASSV